MCVADHAIDCFVLQYFYRCGLTPSVKCLELGATLGSSSLEPTIGCMIVTLGCQWWIFLLEILIFVPFARITMADVSIEVLKAEAESIGLIGSDIGHYVISRQNAAREDRAKERELMVL